MKDMWKSGIWGVIVGDALGTPVQFESREEVRANPVRGMIGYRTFNMPEGTWTDDSALTLATLDSIVRTNDIDIWAIMKNFVQWLEEGKFTPYGFAFDIGRGTMNAIRRYAREKNPFTCGGRTEHDNGNGSIMRIMPAVLYCIAHDVPVDDAVDLIHDVSALTHAHIRSKVACGLYYFMAKSILKGSGSLQERLQLGIAAGFAFYEDREYEDKVLGCYSRLRNLEAFKNARENEIKSTGYVVDTLEAAVWGLITTDSYRDAMLKIVNLGGDTDSIAAVAGGLAGLFYGYDAIPTEWLDVIKRNGWIADMIARVEPAK